MHPPLGEVDQWKHRRLEEPKSPASSTSPYHSSKSDLSTVRKSWQREAGRKKPEGVPASLHGYDPDRPSSQSQDQKKGLLSISYCWCTDAIQDLPLIKYFPRGELRSQLTYHSMYRKTPKKFPGGNREETYSVNTSREVVVKR